MSDLIDEFERDCVAADLAPTAVLKAAGLNASTWFRWKSRAVSPTLRSYEATRRALARLTSGHGVLAPAVDDPATVAPEPTGGADNRNANISRTGESA